MSVKSHLKTDYWKTHHQHSHSWHNVTSGYWSRYPNPQSSHVYTVDMLETKVTEGKLYTKRFILKNNPLPNWGEHFFKTRRVGLIEECWVDPVNKTMVAYVRNIGLTKFMGTTEKATFVPDDNETNVQKECWIDSSIYGFRSAIRRFGIERYKKNSILASQGFEFVLDNMFKKDIGQPIFCESTSNLDPPSESTSNMDPPSELTKCLNETSQFSDKASQFCDKETSHSEEKSFKQAKVSSISGIPLGSYAFKTDKIVQ